jgi:hypothetical protein
MMQIVQQLGETASAIEMLSTEEQTEDFLNLLAKPGWFMDHFRPMFTKWMQDHQGKFFIAKVEEQPVGSIYCELNPPHVSHGEKVPIFGWFIAENPDVAAKLLKEVEIYVIEHDYSILRGPINHPKLFGGWGVLIGLRIFINSQICVV